MATPVCLRTLGMFALTSVLLGGPSAGAPAHRDPAALAGWTLDDLPVTTPAHAGMCPRGAAGFQVTGGGPGPLTYRWQIQTTSGEWVTLPNDLAPIACPGGGEGLMGANPFNSPRTHIAVFDCPGVQHWSIRSLVTGPGGTTPSNEVTLTVCPPDFSCNGELASNDFFDFLYSFFAGDLRADYNHDGAVNSQDYFDFVTAFFVGCD